MIKARAAWHVWHDGKLYTPGVELPVEGDELKRLVESGAAVLPEPVEIETPVDLEPEPEPAAKPRRGRRGA